ASAADCNWVNTKTTQPQSQAMPVSATISRNVNTTQTLAMPRRQRFIRFMEPSSRAHGCLGCLSSPPMPQCLHGRLEIAEDSEPPSPCQPQQTYRMVIGFPYKKSLIHV